MLKCGNREVLTTVDIQCIQSVHHCPGSALRISAMLFIHSLHLIGCGECFLLQLCVYYSHLHTLAFHAVCRD